MAKVALIKEREASITHLWSEDTSKPDVNTKQKFFGTFPYPYVNGEPHMGHMMTFSNIGFMSQYLKQNGFNVLLPFSYHATGMPIVAAAQKLEEELKGNISTPENVDKDSDDSLSVNYKSAKTKMVSKEDGASQIDAMRMMGISDEELIKFTDPWHWVQHFIPIYNQTLKEAGFMIDASKQFTTTDKSPHYDAFIKWQFNKLFKQGKLLYGKRYTIWSQKDKQPCQDHDRSYGEGVSCQEYTLVNIRVEEPKVLSTPANKPVNLLAATMRPETMFGLTNVWVHPELDYDIYDHQYEDVDDYVIMLPRAAKNLMFQGHQLKYVNTIKGKDMIGMKVSQCQVERSLVVLPMTQISETKGTGIVSSVPTESPDDYLNLIVLQNSEHPHTKEMKAKYGDFDTNIKALVAVPIIRAGVSDQIAIEFCKIKKIKNPSALKGTQLQEAKRDIYNKSRKGTFLVKEYQGKPVADVIPHLKDKYIGSHDWYDYAEPESKVISRSGDECVVALDNQWYINYGEDNWKEQVKQHMTTMNFHSKIAEGQFQMGLEWLQKWPCSRTMGMGTKLEVPCPNAEDTNEYLIDSLSDSTMYMILYPIYDILKTLPIEQVTDEVFDFVFLEKEIEHEQKDKLIEMRKQFDYWCPMDLRVSGKDLTQNHLMMCLYNHIAILPKEKWPKSFKINGHIAIDGIKMSKSKGNFITARHILEHYGADALRIVLANSRPDPITDTNYDSTGDTIDGVPELSVLSNAVEKLFDMYQWFDMVIEQQRKGVQRSTEMNFFDKAFMEQIKDCVNNTIDAMEKMEFKEAIKYSFYYMISFMHKYTRYVNNSYHKDVIDKFIEVFLLINTPFIPHMTEHVHQSYSPASESIRYTSFPEKETVNIGLLCQLRFIEDMIDGINHSVKHWIKKNHISESNINKIIIRIGKNEAAWQTYVHNKIHEIATEKGVEDIEKLIVHIGELNKRLAKDETIQRTALNFKKKVQPYVMTYVKNSEMYQFNKFELIKEVHDNLQYFIQKEIVLESDEKVDPMKPQYSM